MYSFTSPIGGPNISVRLAYFHPNRLLIELYKQKRKYVAKKTTCPLKSKQTWITTVPYPILSVARLLTPLIFRYPLPLRLYASGLNGEHGKEGVFFYRLIWPTSSLPPASIGTRQPFFLLHREKKV
jgi:hypothetical protein